MPHPDDDEVTLSPAELRAAWKDHWQEYMAGVKDILAEHADDLKAVQEPTDEEQAECEEGNR